MTDFELKKATDESPVLAPTFRENGVGTKAALERPMGIFIQEDGLEYDRELIVPRRRTVVGSTHGLLTRGIRGQLFFCRILGREDFGQGRDFSHPHKKRKANNSGKLGRSDL
jgi:hypothetical protein